MVFRAIFLSFCLFFLCGCAGNIVTEWDKPGITEEQFKKDLLECEYDAKKHNLESTLREDVALERERELRDMCLKTKGYEMVSREFVPE